jgi:hypothetical protein
MIMIFDFCRKTCAWYVLAHALKQRDQMVKNCVCVCVCIWTSVYVGIDDYTAIAAMANESAAEWGNAHPMLLFSTRD